MAEFSTAQAVLETVGWLHGQGVVHRSLGSSSLLLSTYDQRVSDERLAAKVIDLGFAVTASRLPVDEVTAAMARGATSPLDVVPFLSRADDLHALGYVLLELILGASVADGAADAEISDVVPRPPPDLQQLKRLVEDVFEGDVCVGFRRYCEEEPDWAPAVRLLDEGDRAGWRLLQSLVECREASSERARDVSCAKLLESEWFRA